MQNYFGPFYFGKLKPHNSKYCSNFVLFSDLQLIFEPFNFTVFFALRNSRNKGHANIKGFTVIFSLFIINYVLCACVVKCVVG